MTMGDKTSPMDYLMAALEAEEHQCILCFISFSMLLTYFIGDNSNSTLKHDAILRPNKQPSSPKLETD